MGSKTDTKNFPFEKYFDNNGHRLTVPRKEIIEILNKSNGRLTAEEIYFKVHNKHPAIGLTTVYRTVDLLTNWGLLHRFDFGDGKARYQLINGDDKNGHHHHLICSKCKKVIDYSDFLPEEIELLKNLEHKLSAKYNFDIHNHFVQFQGSCEECMDE